MIVVVLHEVQHTVEEDVGRFDHVDGFEYLAPTVNLALGVAQPEHNEVVVRDLVVHAGHDADAVLQRDGVVFALLRIDIEHDGFGTLGLECVPGLAVLAAQDSRHEHRHQTRLAVARFAADDVEVAAVGDLHLTALQRVPRRRVGLRKIEEVRIDLRAEPVVAFEELRRVTWQRHDLMLLLRYRVFVCLVFIVHVAVLFGNYNFAGRTLRTMSSSCKWHSPGT